VTKTIARILAGLCGGAGGVCRQRAKRIQQPGGAQRGRRARRRVRIKMTAIPIQEQHDSRSSREGTGVVIDERGHIVTIGYIVIEADSIEITTQDDRTSRPTLIGYDHASGFDCCALSMPLGVKPMPMGQAADVARASPVMVLPAGGANGDLAYVVSKRKFAASWEYLLDTAIFTSPPTLQWAGAALVSREGKLVGVGSLFVRETQEGGFPSPWETCSCLSICSSPSSPTSSRRDAGAARSSWMGLATEELHGHLLVTRVSRTDPPKGGNQDGEYRVAWAPDA